jgi:hypothetical protein
MTGAKTPEEAAYCWSKFLIEDTIERRLQGTGIFACVYPFNIGEKGEIVLPTLGLSIGHPPSPQELDRQLEPYREGLYAYLVLMTGLPEAPGVWAGPSYTNKERAEIPIGVPYELCEKGPHVFYVFASLVCDKLPLTWAVRFDGEKFGEIKGTHGHFGGSLLGRLGLGEN